MISRKLVFIVSGLMVATLPMQTLAGAYIFSGEANGVNVITHPEGYTGAGGVINVSVCIDPTSTNAADMVNPVQNAIATWNAQVATSPNLTLGAANDIGATEVDWESAVLHELGHCIGLAHPNAATESGLAGANRNYTKATDGADNAFDLNAGTDGTIGSADDLRGDDVNLHWYIDADNDPCTTTIGTNDASTMSRGLGNLPGADNFAANADRTVCNDLGFPNTEAVMQQGQGNDEDQRSLGGDDIRTLRLAMTGLDETVGGGDDYTINLTYAGLTTACDIPIDFDNSQTGFAVCQTSGNFLNGTHVAITAANIFFNTSANWYFNPFLGAPPVCDAGPSYTAECNGTTTTLTLDGTGSSDPGGGGLTYSWASDCPGASFSNTSSSAPMLTVTSWPGCAVNCGVDLTVTDADNNSVACESTVAIEDTTDPVATCPANVVLECTEPTGPSNTGLGSANDICDSTPGINSSDVEIPGACPQEKTIVRTWKAIDNCGLTDTCAQTIEVVDTAGPTISCNNPATISPNDAPISFTATAVDNCDGKPLVEVTSFNCFRTNGSGKVKSKLESCIIESDGATITIQDSGGVGDQIQWGVSTTDACGNPTVETCELTVVKP